MADSNLKRLHNPNNTVGYEGNVLFAGNFNEIIDHLLLNNVLSADLTLNSIDFGNGITVDIDTKDTKGNFTQLTFKARVKAQKMPYLPNTDKTVYDNADLVSVDTTSSYTVLDKNGTTVDSTTYTLNADGSLTFSSAQTYDFLMVDGLVYIKSKTLTVTRGASGEITSFN